MWIHASFVLDIKKTIENLCELAITRINCINPGQSPVISMELAYTAVIP